jgi:hypothetical protein
MMLSDSMDDAEWCHDEYKQHQDDGWAMPEWWHDQCLSGAMTATEQHSDNCWDDDSVRSKASDMAMSVVCIISDYSSRLLLQWRECSRNNNNNGQQCWAVINVTARKRKRNLLLPSFYCGSAVLSLCISVVWPLIYCGLHHSTICLSVVHRRTVSLHICSLATDLL